MSSCCSGLSHSKDLMDSSSANRWSVYYSIGLVGTTFEKNGKIKRSVYYSIGLVGTSYFEKEWKNKKNFFNSNSAKMDNHSACPYFISVPCVKRQQESKPCGEVSILTWTPFLYTALQAANLYATHTPVALFVQPVA